LDSLLKKPSGRVGEADAAPEVVDGRRKRSEDSRARIVAAMLELVHAGEMAPGAEQVASHAGVGLRTVFRHFNDMDSLYREMSAAIEGEIAEVVAKPLKGENWRERLNDMIARRATAFEKMAPYQRAAAVHRHRSPYLDDGHERFTATCRAYLTAILPKDIVAQPGLLESLDLMLSFETWSRLRREQNLTARRARAVVEETVGKLIG
jgi:AcrR family transcriptional regulator